MLRKAMSLSLTNILTTVLIHNHQVDNFLNNSLAENESFLNEFLQEIDSDGIQFWTIFRLQQNECQTNYARRHRIRSLFTLIDKYRKYVIQMDGACVRCIFAPGRLHAHFLFRFVVFDDIPNEQQNRRV